MIQFLIESSTGTILQASISLNGAFDGPLLAMFTMAILLRFVNAKGVLAGFVGGIAVGLSLALGGIVIPKPQISLPTSYSNCSEAIFDEYLSDGKADLIPPSHFVTEFEDPG